MAAAAAARDWQNVDRALSQLACGAVEDSALGDAAVRAAIAVATPDSPMFEAELSQPLRLRWRDIITPPVRSVRFDPSTPEQLTVRTRSNEVMAILAGVEDDRLVPAPRVVFGGDTTTTLNLVPPWAYDTYSWLPDTSDPSPLETPVLVKEATDLGVFMALAAPDYLRWIQEVTSDVVPVRAPKGLLKSHTNVLVPGRIASTFPLSPVMQGELFVHEASHLHLALASELAPLDDGSDPELYYSPAKKTARPIDRILLAFHAWANIGAFYERCLEKNLDRDGWAERNLAATKKETNELRDGLEKSRALTTHGRALWTPFFE